LHHSVVNNVVEEMVVGRARYKMYYDTGNTKHGSAFVLDLNIKIYNVANLN